MFEIQAVAYLELNSLSSRLGASHMKQRRQEFVAKRLREVPTACVLCVSVSCGGVLLAAVDVDGARVAVHARMFPAGRGTEEGEAKLGDRADRGEVGEARGAVVGDADRGEAGH